MKRKLLSLFMTVCMLLTLLPTVALAADAPSGWITDSNGIMAYKYDINYSWENKTGISLQGYYNGEWNPIMSPNYGLVTVLEVNGNENKFHPRLNHYYPWNDATVSVNGSPYMVGATGMTVDVDANFLYDGKAIQLLYTVHNTNSSDVTFALGNYSRTRMSIGGGYYHTVTPCDGGLVLTKEGLDAQLNFWYGSDIEGVTPVDTCWYGNSGFQNSYSFTDLSNKTSLTGLIAYTWSWKDRTIGPNETQTFSVMFGVGEPGSEILTKEYTVSYSTTVGTEPSNPIVEEGESITLPTLVEPGYEFGGWYSDYELTSPVGDGGANYTPTDNITLYAKWTPILSPVDLTLTKDNGAWAGQSLALYQGGYHKYALTESGTSGVYSVNAQNGTYDIYKDGTDTGVNAVVATTATSGIGDAVPVTIGYTTLTTTTKLDEVDSNQPGDVDYRSEGAVAFSTDVSSPGTYTTILRNTNTNAYDVYVDALDSHQNISTSEESAIINYFTGVVDIQIDDAPYEGRRVVFSRTEGENTYYYTTTYQTSGGNAGKYTVMLPAGASNDYTYTISVDGRVLEDTVSTVDKNATAAYYTAHVDMRKDSGDWTGDDISVYLEKDGLEQKLTYTNSADYQLVLFSDGSVYNVLVSGSNSLRDTGFDLSSNAVQAIDYWSVDFYTTNDAAVYTGRIIQNGKTVSKPSTPNVAGKSFAGWYRTITRDELYDYTSAIVDVTNIYAKFLDPAVSINDTVMGSDTYTIPNMTLTGFPFIGTPIKRATLIVDSGSIAMTSGSGFTVTGSGSKTVTVEFGDEGTTPDLVQAFLRNNTVCTPASTDSGGGGITYTPQTLTVTIGGDTSDGTVTTTTTKIYPVNLNLNEGIINSGNLSYYQEGVGASLPTELYKSGKFFTGWYENADFSGSPVSRITAGDSGEKTYYAKWADGTTSGLIDFGTPVLSGSSFAYPNLELTAPSGLNGNLYSASISIENGTVAVAGGAGYTVRSDLTHLTATINLGGDGMSLTDVELLLRNQTSFTVTSADEYPIVTITLDGNTTTLPGDYIFSAGNGSVGLNGHYYMYVPVSTDWNSAYNLAKTYRYMGMQGYLVTITSAVEDAALDSLTTDAGWGGGSILKQDNEGNYDSNPWVITSASDYFWRWVCGPEAGREFYYGWTTAETNPVDSSGLRIGSGLPGNSEDALYTNWNSGEPNQHDHGESGGKENTLQIHSGSYKWNDIPASWNTLPNYGYFVEFGGYPEGQDLGNPSDSLTLTGSNTAKAYAPNTSGDTIYTNGAALIISGTNAYWDKNSDGVLNDNENDSAIYTSVSSSTYIYAGTTNSFAEPLTGQITVLDGSTVDTINRGNVSGPVVVKLAGDVATTIDFDSITMVEIIDSLTGGVGDIKLTAIGDVGAGRVLAIDKTGAAVIDMTKFTLNNGDNALVAVDQELQISGYGINTNNRVTTTLTGIAPTYITATVEVKENGSLADAESVVLKSESGDSINLNRSATGVYNYIGLLDADNAYTLYVNGVVLGDSYKAFATTNTNQAANYYTAEVTYKVDGNNTDAQSLVLKADGKDDITLTQQTNSETGTLITGVYEYRTLADSSMEYAIWVNGEDSGQTLTFADGEYQKTVNRYTTQVSLNNGGAWSGQTVTLRDDSGNIMYTLNETETSGTYSVLTIGDSVETYNIYVNGEDSGLDIMPSTSAKVLSGIISYMTITITTNKNGSAVRLGDVTVGGKPAIENSIGNYTITLPANSYAVKVAGTNVGEVTGASPSLIADFYTVSYDRGGASGTVPTDNTIYFDGSAVTILSAGELSNTGKVFAGWQTEGTTYNTGQTFTIAGETTFTAQWSDTAAAQASWTVDGTTYYGSLSEAVAAAENNSLPVSITIQNDVTITEDMTIPANVVVNVPEGKSVTVPENVTLTNEGNINSNGTIIGDGTLDNNGTVDNTAFAEISGNLDIDIDNSGGEIVGGTIDSDATVYGGDITGPIVNNGTLNSLHVIGDVTNNGTLTNTDVSGNVTNNSGAVISGGTITGDVVNHNGASITGGTTVNGNVDNEGSVLNIIVNGSMENINGTAIGTTVAGTTTAPGGSVTNAAQLVAALGGAAHIDEVTGAVVLDGDVDLDETITITGDIVIDLNGHSITGPRGNDNDSGLAENGGAAIILSSGTVDIKDTSTGGGGSIFGGAGGAGSTESGTGGAGISVTGGTLNVDEGVEIIGGMGGRDETGSSGSGGPGIEVSDSGNVTIKGDVTGGEGGVGGEGTVGGNGGSGVETSGTVTVAIEGYVTGGTGGAGDTGGTGGVGIINEGTGTVEVNGSALGGSGGMDSQGEVAESGTSLSGAITYSVLESGLTGMKLASSSATSVETENGVLKDNTQITLECEFPGLYDLATSVTVGIYNSSIGTTTAMESSYYSYNSTTGAVIIQKDAPITGNILITAARIKKTGTVTVTTQEELIEALENGFTDIVVNDNISIDNAVTVPGDTTLSVDSGKTITVASGGDVSNNGTITGEGSIAVANGGSITNWSGGSITTTQAIANSGTITNDGNITSAITNSGTIYQVDGASEITVMGTAAIIVLKVSYNVKGIGITPDANLNVTALPNPLPTPTGSVNYTFNGWFMDSNCTAAAVAGMTIVSNTVLYADWVNTGGETSSSDSGGGTESNSTGITGKSAINVIINGKTETAGTETISTESGKSTVTITVNNNVIESKIDEAVKNNTTGEDNIIQVQFSDTKSEIVKVELTGDIVKKLEDNNFDVSVKRDNIEYIIPAKEFIISKVAENLGVSENDLVDIEVEVQITKLDQSVVDKYNEVAKVKGAELIFPPVAFEVVARTTKADGTTDEVEISKFSNYVVRVMEIPSSVDPSKITTGIVFNPKGTYSHIPTEVFEKDDKWYAKLNSLTNSNYSVIWNPVTVKSVENHWSKDAVNDMASRLVIFDPEYFEPDEAITRADFAEYMVRALGLYREGSTYENKFSDVMTTGDRTLAILIAEEYDIVEGYSDAIFKPDELITREEAMTMCQRAMEITKLEGTDNNRYQSYTDYEQVGNWATHYVQEVLSAHVFNGTTATTISPKSNLTYAEAAQAIKNLLLESGLINK